MKYKFEAIIWFPEGTDTIPDEKYLDLGALYYGDKHQDFSLNVVPGTIEKVEE